MDIIRAMVLLEEKFDYVQANKFMIMYWHWSIYISVFYVVSVFGLKLWMKRREAYQLRRPLFIWSLSLALFSIYGSYVVGLTHLNHFYRNGWERSVCDPVLRKNRVGLWSFLFIFSKFPELFDTYFIVLRKKKLIFLHWYHHITVFMYCWYQYSDMTFAGQWFLTMNLFVHSIMYLFFAVRATGSFRPPLWVNMFITSLQLLQMLVGVYVNIYIAIKMSDPTWYCDGKLEKTYLYILISFAMYFTYLVLFAHFFYTSYLTPEKKKLQESMRNGDTGKSSEQSVINGGCAGYGTVVQNAVRHR